MASFKELEKNKVQVEFEIDGETFRDAIQKAYIRERGRYSVPGFRRGKAPRHIIEMNYGEWVFMDPAINDTFPAAYSKALEELGIDAVSQPENPVLNSVSAQDGIKITVDVYTKPDVELGQYKGLEVELEKTVVTDEDVEKELNRRADQNARFVDVERPAQLGDRVVLDYSGSVDGVKFDGGTAEAQNLDLGSGQFIPGFEDQLVGMTAGQEGEINVKFPDEYHSEELSGKDAVFAVKIISVKEKQVPEINDDFAQDASEFDTLEEFKQDIKNNLEKQAESSFRYRLEDMAVQKAVDNASCDIPECMINDQIDYQMQQMEYQMRYQGINFDDYVKQVGSTREQMRDGFRPSARRRVMSQLVLEAIKDAEKVELSDEDVDNAIKEMAEASGSEFEDYKKTVSDEELNYIKDRALYDKVIKVITDSAVLTSKGEESDK